MLEKKIKPRRGDPAPEQIRRARLRSPLQGLFVFRIHPRTSVRGF